MSDDLPRNFDPLVSKAVRSEEYEVSIEKSDGYGWHIEIDGIIVSPVGMPWETFTLPREWDQGVDEDGLEKAREVINDE